MGLQKVGHWATKHLLEVKPIGFTDECRVSEEDRKCRFGWMTRKADLTPCEM